MGVVGNVPVLCMAASQPNWRRAVQAARQASVDFLRVLRFLLVPSGPIPIQPLACTRKKCEARSALALGSAGTYFFEVRIVVAGKTGEDTGQRAMSHAQRAHWMLGDRVVSAGGSAGGRDMRLCIMAARPVPGFYLWGGGRGGLPVLLQGRAGTAGAAVPVAEACSGIISHTFVLFILHPVPTER
jgi:hypothetical protein